MLSGIQTLGIQRLLPLFIISMELWTVTSISVVEEISLNFILLEYFYVGRERFLFTDISPSADTINQLEVSKELKVKV